MAVAGAGAGAGAEIWSKSEPKPKINNFGSATLAKSKNHQNLHSFFGSESVSLTSEES